MTPAAGSAPGGGSAPVAALRDDPVAWLLARPDSRDFVAGEFGRTWVHARGGAHRFADLLSLADLDAVLGRFGLRHPAIKLVRSDGPVPLAEYAWRDAMVDPARVAQCFAEGATVIYGGLHDRHEPLRVLCDAVSAQVSARTQTNIYLTPPHAQGFKPHWDTHDVFVLQVEGTKRWRIYAGGPERPLKDHRFDPAVHAPGAVEHELTLEAGDVLYVPRGVMHAAATTDAISLHVTLGVMAYTWADLLVDGISELVEREPAWRSQVPFGFAADGRASDALQEAMRERLATLAATLDLDAVVAARARAFAGHLRPRADDHLRQAAGAASVAPADVVRWRDGMTAFTEQRGDRLVVACGTREVELPAIAAPTIARLRTGAPCPAGALDDGLDWPSRHAVLAALIAEGWVVREGGGQRRPRGGGRGPAAGDTA